ncbi:family 7 glycoside hydrolase [Melampsora americana]|nr:family 7 glycoside hydrolase [Melampsora americana]
MNSSSLSIFVLSIFAFARAQQIGKLIPEVQPKLNFRTCTKAGGCTKHDGTVTLDSKWRPIHAVNSTKKCQSDSGAWDPELCPDGLTCAKNCALEGVDYCDFGVTSDGDSLSLKLGIENTKRHISPRVYLLDDKGQYVSMKLKNQEFTFDVDVSNLPCGTNGALYLSEMEADGGTAKYPTNKAGSLYGVGYCDAQCPQDVTYLGGKVNLEGWKSDGADGTGHGNLGSCCTEMDIWEANSEVNALTPHACKGKGPQICDGDACGAICDKGGCDLGPYRYGDHDFFGPKKIVDTTQKFTVVTQFLTDNQKHTGQLVEIRRKYIQNGKVIQNSKTKIPSMKSFDSISPEFCNASKTALEGGHNDFQDKGGFTALSDSLERGMVLAMSIWDDHSDTKMLWLDGSYPIESDPKLPGVVRGPCTAENSNATFIEKTYPNATVVFSNIRIGDLDSTCQSASNSSTISSDTPAAPIIKRSTIGHSRLY